MKNNWKILEKTTDWSPMVRAPGFEPGFPRWQRGVITTTLRSRRLNEIGGLLLSIGQTKLRKKSCKTCNDGITSLSEYLNTLPHWVF